MRYIIIKKRYFLFFRSTRRAARFKARGNGFRHRARPCLKTSTWSTTGGCSSKWRGPRNWAASKAPWNRIASLNWTSLRKRIKRPRKRIPETRRGTKHSYCEHSYYRERIERIGSNRVLIVRFAAMLIETRRKCCWRFTIARINRNDS